MEEIKKYVVGVDFGSSNLVMAVGTTDEKTGLVKVEALVSRPSAGIEYGVIQNVNKVSEVLGGVKAEIEQTLGIRINEAYAGLSGAFIHYQRYSDHVFIGDNVDGIVAQTDVDALHDRMNRVTVLGDEMVLDRFPLNYMLDGRRETENPVGAFSRQLSSTFAFIVSKKQPLTRLKMVFDKSNIKLAGIFANSVITASAVLGPEEMSEGTAVVDIGGGTTDVTVCYGDQVRYAATIPLGGSAIDSDINNYGVSKNQVENIKKNHGTAIAESVPENKGLKIPVTGHGFKTVMKRNIASIIEARLTDIAEYVKVELKDSDYDSKLPFGLVITGGSAAIPDIDILFSRLTGREVRVAKATEGIDISSQDKIDSTEFTSAVAILIEGAKTGWCEVDVTETRPQSAQTVTPASDAQPVQPVKPAQPVQPQQSEPKPFGRQPQPAMGGETFRRHDSQFVPPVRKPEPATVKPAVPQPQPVEPKPQTAPVQPPVQPEPAKEAVQPASEPVAEKPREQSVRKPDGNKRRGLFSKLIDRLNNVMINGDEYEDVTLDDVSESRRESASSQPAQTYRQQESQESRKRRIRRDVKLDADEFFVDGEDKDEI